MSSVFLDLPLSPNAVEQRIGRVDRFNLRARADGTRCLYLAEKHSPWVTGLLHFLRNVAGVFDQSVATLQRPLENLEERVRGQLLHRGPGAFSIPAAEAEQLMEDERAELDLLSEIEDIQFFTDFSDASFNQLLRFEEHPEKVEGAFARLMGPGGIGIRARTAARHADVVEFGLADARDGAYGLNAGECAAIKPHLPVGGHSARSSRAPRPMSAPSGSGTHSSTGWLATCGATNGAGPSPSSSRLRA